MLYSISECIPAVHCRMLNYVTKKGASNAQTLGIIGRPSFLVADGLVLVLVKIMLYIYCVQIV